MSSPATLQTRSAELPLVGIQMEVRNVTRAAAAAEGDAAPAARFELVFTTGAPVLRYDWQNGRYYMEVLEVSKSAINLDRLERGAPLLNSHSRWSLEDQIGVCDQPSISKGQGIVQAQLSRRESVRGIVQDLEDRVIRNVSVGYVRDAIEMVAPAELNGMWTYNVTRWTPQEVSLTPIPADMDSQVRSVNGRLEDGAGHEVRSYPCTVTEIPASQETPTVGITAATTTRKENSMSGPAAAGGNNTPATEVTQTQAAPAAAPAAAVAPAAPAATDTRAADIADLCTRHGVSTLAAGLIRSGNTIDQARAAVLAELAVRDIATGGHRNVGRIVTVQDEMDVRLAGIEMAILHRVSPGTKLDDNGRNYRGMSLLEMGREFLEAHHVSTRGMTRMQLATQMVQFRSGGGGSMGTSDFTSLFANVANKRLRAAYDENAGSYAVWARRAPNAPDFKNMSVVQLAGAPDLLQVNEEGEFKYGAMTDGAETYGLLTYGRIVSLSRQAIVNDDLRAFERMVSAFGFAARRLENRTVYSQLTANAAMGDGVALFHATHGNLLTTSALTITTLGSARTAMRLQKGKQSEELNLAPNYLIVPATLEQTAYNLTSANYVPATKGEINEFRAGGKTAVTPIVEAVLDANSTSTWYTVAANAQVDTVEYCYLDGEEGPVIESRTGFESDGFDYKCRLDFATKAIDHRGMTKATA